MRRREAEEDLTQPPRASSRQRAALHPTRARLDRSEATPATSPPLGSGHRGVSPWEPVLARGRYSGMLCPRAWLQSRGLWGSASSPGLREQQCHAAVISSRTTAYPWGITGLKTVLLLSSDHRYNTRIACGRRSEHI